MSYTHPELVRRLVARLRGGVVAVHHDPRRCALGEVDALVIPPAPVEWGHGSQLAAILRGFAWLRAYEWDWLVLLSGQDYPVRPVAEIASSLLAAPDDAFIRHTPVPPRVLPRRRPPAAAGRPPPRAGGRLPPPLHLPLAQVKGVRPL